LVGMCRNLIRELITSDLVKQTEDMAEIQRGCCGETE
jgi:hypothetical protein